jgi:hypothetical protein
MADAEKVAPAVASHDSETNHARVTLSFGPQAIVIPTEDQCGFTVLVLRALPDRSLCVPVLKARVTFGPDLKPIIEHLEVTNEQNICPDL